MGDGYVDLRLLSDDAVYRDDQGTEHVVEWVTQRDVDLARRVTEIAAEQAVDADPASITTIELALDTAHAATIAPVWAALLTGSTEARGRATIGDDVRDATGRVPILWFQDTDEHETHVSGSTSTSGCRPRWPNSGSTRRSPRVGSSLMTARRRRTP
jgi:4a-hydroxytetrahydrobiopterin dehydratase